MIRVGESNVDIYTGSDLNQRKIERTDEESSKTQKKDCFHQFDFDIEFVNYVKETVPKTTWVNNCLQELWEKQGYYLKTVRESQNEYGFDDVITGAAYAYSAIYEKIVEEYRNGTRTVYVCDNPESGERRKLTMDEELERLNSGFESLIEWDQMVAESRMRSAEMKWRELNGNRSSEKYDENQVRDAKPVRNYIKATFLEFRSHYQKEYETTGGNVDIKSLVSSILQDSNRDIYDYCKNLFYKIGYIT